ncbi:hypothetical protein AKJ16_DCAP23743 [Drosera capensis]
MEFFHGAKAVRLRSHQNKYLIAEDDEESIRQSNNGSSRNARWSVEFIPTKPNSIRLKSCHTWKYLSASDEPFLLGWTGKRVVQASPRVRDDPSVIWEPVEDRERVKLRSGKGRGLFLRANASLPPWRNSVTHDVPSRTATQDWVLWEVEIVENDHSHEVVKQEVKIAVEVSRSEEKDEVDQEEEERESTGSSSETVYEAEETGDHVLSSSPGSARSVSSVSSKFQLDAEPITRISSMASDETSSKSSARASVQVQRGIAADSSQSARQSNSFTNLKSMLDDVQKLLDSDETVKEDKVTTTIPTKKPTSLEVRMAKQTLKDLKDVDFRSISSSETRLRRIQNAISVLYNSNDRQLSHHSNFRDLQLQFVALRDDYFSASDDLSQYAVFSLEKSTLKSEFRKDVAKARELETREEECNNNLNTAYARRAELLRQLEEVEKDIEENEKARLENANVINQFISEIEQKSQVLKEMESKEKSLQYKKNVAEKKINQVQEDWVKIKHVFSDL